MNYTQIHVLTLGTEEATGPMYAKISGSSIEKRLEELRSSGISSAAEKPMMSINFYKRLILQVILIQ